MHELNEREAFQAMTCFLWQWAQHGGNDLSLLLFDIRILADGGTSDPAAWEDWLQCVRATKEAIRDSSDPLRK
jgi:hypothetical protein